MSDTPADDVDDLPGADETGSESLAAEVAAELEPDPEDLEGFTTDRDWSAEEPEVEEG
jgi:hypothetical protein